MKAFDEALAVSETIRELHSEDGDGWFNHGELMTSLNRHREALYAYEKAFFFRPDSVKARIAAAVSEAALGRLESAGSRLQEIVKSDPAALSSFRSPLETDRESVYPELEPGRIALIAAYQRVRCCDWSSRADFIRLFQRVVDGDGCRPMDNPDLPFLGLGFPLSGEYRLRAASQVARRIERGVQGVRLVRSNKKHTGRIRVGYISGDFRRHATAYLVSCLPALHDRNLFEVFVYSSGPDDESDIRKEIAEASDSFRDVSHLDWQSTAQRIVMDGVDILVDLSGYTLHASSAVLAMRPARIQVSYLAYLQSMGAPWIDYTLLDRAVLVGEERKYW